MERERKESLTILRNIDILCYFYLVVCVCVCTYLGYDRDADFMQLPTY